MTQDPKQFYNTEKQFFESKLKTVKKKLATSSMLRLIVFLVVAYGIYFSIKTENEYSKIVIPLTGLGIVVFLLLVSKHTDFLLLKAKIQALIKVNKTEIDVINGDKSALELGHEFKNSNHAFSYDIDLFGEGSFFQYLNRTATNSGKQKLAQILTENTINSIEEKQKALKDLSKKAKWRQNFTATASLVNVETSSKSIENWLDSHQSFLPKLMRYLPRLVFIISMTLFVLKYMDIIPFSFILIWFFIGLGITGIYFKKVTSLYQKASKAKGTFKQYHQLLSLIETESFESELLIKKQHKIKSENKKASSIFMIFSKALDALDQRNNILFSIFGNAFALWDIQQSYKIEQWIITYHKKVSEWFQVIAFFDAHNSLANFVFNHQDYAFPQIIDNKFSVQAKDLGHPLLDKNKRIDNNFTIKNQEFFIITGANMAGKSTFLRTVSLSIMMSNIGLPVCAKSFNYSPIKLITSMRTSDSLTDDESYFFSELKRLKFIVEEIKSNTYFIILDEILKGTNSKDKAIGSRKFVEKLVGTNSTGIIATHDLSLCTITEELNQVKNYYFDAEIINNELHFDYTFKTGICQNMNASFLLKKMKIVD
jgi:DNA mismatch repair ATPase MutS